MNTHLKLMTVSLFIISLSGCAELKQLRSQLDQQGSSPGLSQYDIASGLKEALRVGSSTVVSKLGRRDGFNKDKVAHIILPKNLLKVQKTLKQIGYGKYLDDLELKINRAAEVATPKAKALFVNAITQLTWTDVKKIYNGPDDAATRYFQGKMTSPLKKEMTPVINNALARVGVIQSYEKAMSKYNSLPFVPDVRADLTTHTLDKTLGAIFYYLGQEEAAIRKDPVKRTTAILKKVFGYN